MLAYTTASRDVVDFMREFSRSIDKDDSGINFVLLQRPPGVKADPNAALGAAKHPTLTMNLRDVTMKEALDLIMDVTGYGYKLHDNAVLVFPRK